MPELHQVLAERVAGWRATGHAHNAFPAVGEILAYARDEDGASRYLREPQIRALEVYWYLRLVEGTPRIGELYQRLIPRPADRLRALGLDASELTEIVLNDGYEGLLDLIRTDDDLVRRHRLESVRETLSFDYPSYILALAMGAGKTILVGAIVATEFAMALEYPDADPAFVENALVFAPGKTIIESLRELASTRSDELLPPRLHAPFATSLKLTFTRDGERDIPVTRGSRFNLVVTNTEKIRIQARRAALHEPTEVAFTPPTVTAAGMQRTTFDVGLATATQRVLRQTGDALALDVGVDMLDLYAAAAELAAAYREPDWPLLQALRRQQLVERNSGRLARHVAWVNGSVRPGEVEAIRGLAGITNQG